LQVPSELAAFPEEVAADSAALNVVVHITEESLQDVQNFLA
jgi:hypothetical protein